MTKEHFDYLWSELSKHSGVDQHVGDGIVISSEQRDSMTIWSQITDTSNRIYLEARLQENVGALEKILTKKALEVCDKKSAEKYYESESGELKRSLLWLFLTFIYVFCLLIFASEPWSYDRKLRDIVTLLAIVIAPLGFFLFLCILPFIKTSNLEIKRLQVKGSLILFWSAVILTPFFIRDLTGIIPGSFIIVIALVHLIITMSIFFFIVKLKCTDASRNY